MAIVPLKGINTQRVTHGGSRCTRSFAAARGDARGGGGGSDACMQMKHYAEWDDIELAVEEQDEDYFEKFDGEQVRQTCMLPRVPRVPQFSPSFAASDNSMYAPMYVPEQGLAPVLSCEHPSPNNKHMRCG